MTFALQIRGSFNYCNTGLPYWTTTPGGSVKNSGKVDGDEVAQVYFRHVKSAVPQAKLALCGFSRVSVKKGESKQVTIGVPVERLT